MTYRKNFCSYGFKPIHLQEGDGKKKKNKERNSILILALSQDNNHVKDKHVEHVIILWKLLWIYGFKHQVFTLTSP